MPPPPPSGDVDAADDDAWNGTYIIKRAKNFHEYDTGVRTPQISKM